MDSKKVSAAPEYNYNFVQYSLRAKRTQYGLKHHVTSTIHASMSDTLSKVALAISDDDDKELFVKAQVVVAIS